MFAFSFDLEMRLYKAGLCATNLGKPTLRQMQVRKVLAKNKQCNDN